MIALDAFGGDLLRDVGGVNGPSMGWPPVIATASLYRILYVMFTSAATAARMARMPLW